MQNLKTIAIIVLVILAVSCKKDNKNSGGTTGQKILTMKVDGVDWVADDNAFGFITKSNNKAAFGGTKTSSNETLGMNNVEVTATGTYVINKALNPTHNFTFLKAGASPKPYSVSTTFPKSRASFTVSKINVKASVLDNIEGNFSGVLYYSASDSVVITDGVFKFN